MNRDQKIEKLAEEHFKRTGWTPTEWAVMNFKAGLLAGIRLRDEELLAMEFDVLNSSDAFDIAIKEYPNVSCDEWRRGLAFSYWQQGARWQHEQFIKAIKGDG